MIQYSYLQDASFLKQIDLMKVKEQYVKITVLNFYEEPIDTIQGKIISGSLNINGSSAVRRTCNLNMVTGEEENDFTRVNRLISINKKIQLEIGYTNTTEKYKEYKIIWFPLGVYVISNVSLSHSAGGISVSLQLKDKMCLLNGECGGTLPASTQFDKYETADENGNIVILQPTIYQIIQEAVSHFGGEQLGKIIISDIDNQIKQVVKWTGSRPLYLYYKENGECGATLDEQVFSDWLNAGYTANLYAYGEDVGYIYTDFVYANDLIIDGGGSVCDVLDAVKSYLGNYEYFYDIYGNFIFQEIKNYVNTSQSTDTLNKIRQNEELDKNNYLIDLTKGKAVYTFDNGELITSYSNTPQYNKIKNDFIVWGKRTSASGVELPIRYHLAIDDKPQVGNEYIVFFYQDPDDGLKKAKTALKYNALPADGYTDQFYYVDNIMYIWDGIQFKQAENITDFQIIKTEEWRDELYLQGAISDPLAIDSNYYYTELKNEWPKQYDTQNGQYLQTSDIDPTSLDFYLDFIDSDSAISELSVSNIGRRSVVVNDDNINCLFTPTIPDLVFINIKDGVESVNQQIKVCRKKSQNFCQLSEDMYNALAFGGSFNSAYDKIRELLYEYTNYNENISLQTIPIYYLEPNTKISVRDSECGIFGDYMVNSISIPLDISSTMSISCTRVIERL